MHAKKKTADAAYQDLTKNIDISVLQENVRVFFSQFPDPRKSERVIYPAWYIILVILCSYLSGCNTISDIAHFAEIKNGWLNTLLGLNFRPVSYDTIWWFFVRVKPEAFKELMTEWIGALSGNMRDQLLAIDGKRLRGVSNQDHISHLVELFATESKLVIAQKKVPDKKCERTAVMSIGLIN